MKLSEPTYEKLWRQTSARLEFIEKSLRVLAMNQGFTKWMDEAEVMVITRLSKRTLLEKRKSGVFNWSTEAGRKIKYLRKDVENYLNGNSTLRKVS